MNADPHFVYLQEMARVFGLEAVRMADADVLPYDYVAYAREITSYIDAAKRKAGDAGLSARSTSLRLWRLPHDLPAAAEQCARQLQTHPPADLAQFNQLCARPRPPCSPRLDCPTGPGTNTPSTRPANTPATRRSSFPA